MAVDEVSRHELVGKLQEVLGPRPAATFMEMYPLLGDEIATRQHVAAESVAVRQDLADFKHDVATEFASVRHDMAAEFASVRHDMAAEFASVRHDMAAEFASVRHDMAAEFASVGHDLASVRQELGAMNNDLHKDMDLLRFELLAAFRGEINTALTSQMRSIVFANTSLFVAFAGLVWSLKVF